MDSPFNTEDIDSLLELELAKLSVEASPKRSPHTASAASVGTRIAAKRLSTENFSTEISIALDYDEVLNLLKSYFSTPTLRNVESDNGSAVAYAEVVGSGFFNMNPTLLIAVARESGNSIAISAYAKEGLIKQRSAEKAVRACADALLAASGQNA